MTKILTSRKIMYLGIFIVTIQTLSGSLFDSTTKVLGSSNFIWYHYYTLGIGFALILFLLYLTFTGIICLLLVSSNVVVGVNSLVPESITLCEDLEPLGDIEFKDFEVVNGTTLTIFWTVKNVTLGENYTISWDISQNGSQELVDSGSISWEANGNTFQHLKMVNVQTEPYAWTSTLFDENMTVISTTNGDYSSSEISTMSNIESGKNCEDNPKLILSEIMDFEDLDSWTQAGDGDMLDGMLIMAFSFISLLGIRKKKN